VRRSTSPEPATQGARPRPTADACPICLATSRERLARPRVGITRSASPRGVAFASHHLDHCNVHQRRSGSNVHQRRSGKCGAGASDRESVSRGRGDMPAGYQGRAANGGRWQFRTTN
jgi:hypothetical protein